MRTLLLYLAAAVAYIGLGVYQRDVLYSWLNGAGFLLVAVWILPALARAIGRRMR